MKLVEDAMFTVNRDLIVAATTATEWRYLGVFYAPFGQKRLSMVKTLEQLLQRVSAAPLRPQQRVVILRYYLLPRLYHALALSPLTVKFLTKLDVLVRAAVRRWLHLPHDVPVGGFHAPLEAAGLAIPSLRTIPGLQVHRLERLADSSMPACQQAVRMSH
ncbi:hypothetical protein V5799_024574 [Amblyomma americanum]|uniref:Uncharacterized protein n=1 Tax=Amblyomma americanum TaxID=6943 RepID=A0AAQ4EC44_AMBAM